MTEVQSLSTLHAKKHVELVSNHVATATDVIPKEPLDCFIFAIYLFIYISTCWWLFRKVLRLFCKITCCVLCVSCRKSSKKATKKKGAPASGDAKRTPAPAKPKAA